VGFQVGYLLTVFRQRCLLEPAAIAQKLVTLGLIDPARNTAPRRRFANRFTGCWGDLANLPAQAVDASWIAKIDPDYRAQVDGGEPPAPTEVKRAADQAQRRRERQTELARERRAKS
jgi:hypothetical protein